MEKKNKRISVRVYPKFYQRIKDVMKFKGISQTQLITNAIDEYLKLKRLWTNTPKYWSVFLFV